MKFLKLGLSAALLGFVNMATMAQSGEPTAQQVKRNTFFAEVTGASAQLTKRPLVGINYDRLLLKQGAWGFSARIGLASNGNQSKELTFPEVYEIRGTFSRYEAKQARLTVPLSAHLLYQIKGAHHLDLSAAYLHQVNLYNDAGEQIIINSTTGQELSRSRIPYDDGRHISHFTQQLSYRYQAPEGGLFARAGALLWWDQREDIVVTTEPGSSDIIVNSSKSWKPKPQFSVSVGWTF